MVELVGGILQTPIADPQQQNNLSIFEQNKIERDGSVASTQYQQQQELPQARAETQKYQQIHLNLQKGNKFIDQTGKSVLPQNLAGEISNNDLTSDRVRGQASRDRYQQQNEQSLNQYEMDLQRANMQQRPTKKGSKSMTAPQGQRRTRKTRRKDMGVSNGTVNFGNNPTNLKVVSDQQRFNYQVSAGVRSSRRSTSSVSVQRKNQIYGLLQQVENLQVQISKIPDKKGRHYVNPYIKIGQASNLNLTSQNLQQEEQAQYAEARRKLLIQRQAQILLQQIEEEKPQSTVNDDDTQCNCILSHHSNHPQSPQRMVRVQEENAATEDDQQEELCDFHKAEMETKQEAESEQIPRREALQIQNVNKSLKEKAPESHHSCESHLQCEECGHICITNTEKTLSEHQANFNLLSLDLEDEQNRRKHFSLLNKTKSIDAESTDAAQTVHAHDQFHHIALKNPCCDQMKRVHTILCQKCGSNTNHFVRKPEIQRNNGLQKTPKTLNQIASERYVITKKSQSNSRGKGIFQQSKLSSPIRHLKNVSNMNVNPQIKSNETMAQMYGTQLQDDRLGATSVQFVMSNQDGAISTNSHEDFGQLINLQIQGQNQSEHQNSKTRIQQKNIHKTRSKERTGSGSKGRPRSQNRSKSRKSIKIGDGNIMCGRCAEHHAPKRSNSKPLKKPRLSSAKPKIDAINMFKNDQYDGSNCCPVHGHHDHDDSITELEPTRRVASRDGLSGYQHRPECENCSENMATEKADLESKKIQDSVEFTSVTCTARRQLNLDYLDDDQQEQLSDDLISELRAIANGNFLLGAEPLQLSSQMSIQTDVKSNRINLLSLGAYTVNEAAEFDLSAQSNIATNEMDSQHQTSLYAHTELDSRQVHSNTRAQANEVASGAYGSEIAYSTSNKNQAGGYPLKQMLVNEEPEEAEEEYEEEMEEESELTIEQEQKTEPDFPIEEDDEDMHSHNTSYSEFYIIDEKEEQRLKEVAFEKYMAEQAIVDQMKKRDAALKIKKQEAKIRAREARERAERGEEIDSSDIQSQAVPITPILGTHEKSTEQVNLIGEQVQGSSIELKDQSCQYYSKDGQSKDDKASNENSAANSSRLAQQTQVQSPLELVNQIGQHQGKTSVPSAQISEIDQREENTINFGTIEPRESQYDENYYASQIDDKESIAQSYMTGQKTVKAFKPQMLYEEAVHIPDGVSNVTRPQHVQQVEDYITMEKQSAVDQSQTNLLVSEQATNYQLKIGDPRNSQAFKVKFDESRYQNSGLPPKSTNSLKLMGGPQATRFLQNANNTNKSQAAPLVAGNKSQDHFDQGMVSEPGSMYAEAPFAIKRQSEQNDPGKEINTFDVLDNNNIDHRIIHGSDELESAHVPNTHSQINSDQNIDVDDDVKSSMQQRKTPTTAFRQLFGTLQSHEEIRDERQITEPGTEIRQVEPSYGFFQPSQQNENSVVMQNSNQQVFNKDIYASQQPQQIKSLFKHDDETENAEIVVNEGKNETSQIIQIPAATQEVEQENHLTSRDRLTNLSDNHQQQIMTNNQPGSDDIVSGSPASRSNLTYKSHRKSLKPVMVDQSQQDSRIDYRDQTFMEVQESSVPNSQFRQQDSVQNDAFRVTMLSSQMQPATNSISVENNNYIQGDRVMLMSEDQPYSQQLGGQSRNESQSRQQITTVDSGRNVSSSEIAICNNQRPEYNDQQQQTSEKQEIQSPVHDNNRDEKHKMPSEQSIDGDRNGDKEPKTASRLLLEEKDEKTASEPRSKEKDDKDAGDAYVRQMMQNRGIKLLDDHTDLISANTDSAQQEKFDVKEQMQAVTRTCGIQPSDDNQKDHGIDDDSIQRHQESQQETIKSTINHIEKDVGGPDEVGLHLKSSENQQSPERVITSASLLPSHRIKEASSSYSNNKHHQSSSRSGNVINANKTQYRQQTRNVYENLPQKIAQKGYTQTEDLNKKDRYETSGERQNSTTPNDERVSQNSNREVNQAQFSSIKEMRSPKTYKINKRGIKSQEKSGTKSRRPQASDISYFTSKGGQKSIRKYKKDVQNQPNQLYTGLESQQQLQDSPLKEGKAVNIQISSANGQPRARSRIASNNSNIYEQSPKVPAGKTCKNNQILAQGEGQSLNPWNETTEQNLQNFIQQRAAKRIKQISNEVDLAKQPLFSTKKAHQNQLIQENQYLRSGNLSHTNIAGQNAVKRNGSMQMVQGMQEVYSQDQELQTQHRMGGQASSVLSSCGADQLDVARNMNKYVSSEAKNSLTSFEQLHQAINNPQHFWTSEKEMKGAREYVNRGEFNTVNETEEWQQPMSNFSQHYNKFKQNKLGKSVDRRNINLPVMSNNQQQKMLGTDHYSNAHVLSSDDETAHTALSCQRQLEAQRLKMATSLTRDGFNLQYDDLMNESMLPSKGYTRSKGTLNVDKQNHHQANLLSSNRKNQRTATSSIGMLQKLRQSYSTAGATTQNRANTTFQGHSKQPIFESIGGPPVGTKNTAKLTFYPQTNGKKTSHSSSRAGAQTGIRLNTNISQQGKGSSFVSGNHLVHDNQHAPYLGVKHMKTTAYL